jgi:riboflavin synthase
VFTGIVQEIGSVVSVAHTGDGSTLQIDAAHVSSAIRVGDSVAVDGVCLTVVAADRSLLSFDAINETLERTTLGSLEQGRRVNLEAALRAGEPLGGHIVQGHIDAVGGVVAERADGFSRVLEIVLPAALGRYIIGKGSIAVQGVSLTVAAVTRDGFEVCLIPRTSAVTTLGEAAVGTRVNLEVDMFAKYIERLVSVGAIALPARETAATIAISDQPTGVS